MPKNLFQARASSPYQEMALTHSIDIKRQVVFVTATGVLTDDDLQFGVAAMRWDPHFDQDMRGLLDLTQVTRLSVTATTLASLTTPRTFSAKSRRAFLIASGLAGATMEFYRMNVVTGRVEVFDDRAKALKWLNDGVPPEKILT